MVPKVKCLFFCGHKSLYGASHLELLLNSPLDIVGIVLATDERWDKFRRNLTGEQYLTDKKALALPKLRRMRRVLRKGLDLLPKSLSHSITAPSVLPHYPNAEEVAAKYKAPIYYADNVNSREFLKFMGNINPDLIICAAYPQIFSKELIEKPGLGAINFHPSLLPKFRGAHPHFWAIREGEEKSGITAHFMTENIDDGDIIAQIEFPIKEHTYLELYKKIIEESPKAVNQVCRFFIEGQGKSLKQEDSMATYYRNDRPIHHRIFWNIQTANEIYNLVRTGKAFCFFRSLKVLINKCYLSETNRNLTNNVKVENGTLVDIYKDSMVAKAKNGCINMELLSYNGKRMSSLTFAKKFRVEVGEKFE